MRTNEQVIYNFFKAFQIKDYKTMQDCYAANAKFSDPVFPNLKGDEINAMWEMFCVKSKDLIIEFRNINSNETKGRAEWTAVYTFLPTGKEVVNNVYSNFTFKDGKITRHTDYFDFYKWSKQALGLKGTLLGWTPFVKTEIQEAGMKSLKEFINRKNMVVK